MLASMSEIDPRADTPLVDWSELSVSGLVPTGTVTLLLADVEGSTRLWETHPDEMTAAIVRLNQAVSDIISAHDGVRPVEQGEGDSFVAAFSRASDAVAAALALQRAPPAPIRLRIGVHSGEVQLRDEGNYAGPTINRTARLRDLGHGGQTLLSGVTEALVLDVLPSGAWLTELGTHPLRDLPRPERVIQLCHSDLVNDFPPLRVSKSVISQRLPMQFTSFVGRRQELSQVHELLTQNRLLTLTGAGGAGKTRLAIQTAGQLSGEFDRFPQGVWYVDLAPITDPELVPLTVARAFGLPDQPGRSTMDTLIRFVADRQMLVVLDNCEHLLDACADLVVALLGSAPGLTLLTTSREPIGVPGEATWRVPSLSVSDEAIELFTDRARLIQIEFAATDDNASVRRLRSHVAIWSRPAAGSTMLYRQKRAYTRGIHRPRAPAWRSRRVSRSRPSVTPTRRSRTPPKSRRTCSSPTSWNASAFWPAMPAVSAKRPASSARQTASGTAWDRRAVRSILRSTSPGLTDPRSSASATTASGSIRKSPPVSDSRTLPRVSPGSTGSGRPSPSRRARAAARSSR